MSPPPKGLWGVHSALATAPTSPMSDGHSPGMKLPLPHPVWPVTPGLQRQTCLSGHLWGGQAWFPLHSDPVTGWLVPEAELPLGTRGAHRLGWAVASGGALPPHKGPSLHCQAGVGHSSRLEKRPFFLSQPLTKSAGGGCRTQGAGPSKQGLQLPQPGHASRSPASRALKAPRSGKSSPAGQDGEGGRAGPPHSFRGLHMSCPGGTPGGHSGGPSP